MADDFEEGFLVGLLVGEGHFGGDGRSPQVTLRMHVRHASLFEWIDRVFPGGRVYGPYFHGGRHYLQWMARGPFLRDFLLPLLERRLSADLDSHARSRLDQMRARYARRLGLPIQQAGGVLPSSKTDSELTSADAPAVSGATTPMPGEKGPAGVEAIFAKLRAGQEREEDPPT